MGEFLAIAVPAAEIAVLGISGRLEELLKEIAMSGPISIGFVADWTSS